MRRVDGASGGDPRPAVAATALAGEAPRRTDSGEISRGEDRDATTTGFARRARSKNGRVQRRAPADARERLPISRPAHLYTRVGREREVDATSFSGSRRLVRPGSLQTQVGGSPRLNR